MSQTPKITKVYFIIFGYNPDGLLIIREHQRDKLARFPSVLQGDEETPEQAFVREVTRCTGLIVPKGEIIFIADLWGKKHMRHVRGYVTPDWYSLLKENERGETTEIIPVDRLQMLNFTNAHRRILDKVLRVLKISA